MSVVAIVQARMGSSRLPGKTMMSIGRKPMIYYLIESLARVLDRERIWIATSTCQKNNPIRAYAQQNSIKCYSGHEDDVASRYAEILKALPSVEYFFRICGDSPYFAWDVMLDAKNEMKASLADFVTSKPNFGLPLGTNIELFNSNLFLKYHSSIAEKADKEHVTQFFYNSINQFNASLYQCKVPDYQYEAYKFSVDTVKDFDLATRMLELMDYSPWNYTLEAKMTIQKSLKLANQ